MTPESNASPFESNNSATPVSTTVPGRPPGETRENSAMSTSHSSPTYGVGQTYSSFQSPHQQVHPNYSNEQHGISVYQGGAVPVDVDDNPTLDSNLKFLQHQSQMSRQVAQGSFTNLEQINIEQQDRFKVDVQPVSSQQRSFFDDEDSDYPEEGEAATAGDAPAAQGSFSNQISPRTSRKRPRLPGVFRDSGYASKTNSMQPFEGDFDEQPRPTSTLANSLNQTVEASAWDSQIFPLHSIPYNPMQYQGGNTYDHAGNTFLLKLAPTGAPWECFETAFAMGMEVNHENAFGQTFAHVLNVSHFRENLLPCLSRLQELGFNFAHRDHSGSTVLHCLYGQPIAPKIALGALQYFQSPGHQLCLRDVSGRTPYGIFKETYLREASKSPKWAMAMSLSQVLDAFEEVIKKSGHLNSGNTSCEWLNAAPNLELRRQMQEEYKRVTVNAKYDINLEARDGSNAIHSQAALLSGHTTHADIEELKKYISLGIDVNSYDIYGRTPLEAMITQHRYYESELTTSEKVCLLVDSGGASVHFRNRLGQTPLYSAAIRGLDRTVEALLARNANVNIRAADGKSLRAAVKDAGLDAFTEYFISGDYLMSEESVASERPPYHEAQCSRIEACLELLCKAGAVLEPSPEQAFGYPHSAVS